MLKRLKFKNWRSLRDVEIDNLTPITVFIGANSSGKTNILDALHFLRYATDKGLREAVFAWRGRDKIRTFGVDDGVMVDYELQVRGTVQNIALSLFDSFENAPTDLTLSQAHYNPHNTLDPEVLSMLITQRWQLLREGFSPFVSLITDADLVDFYVIDPLARHVPTMLNFMHELSPVVYRALQEDLRSLLSHVTTLETERNDVEYHFSITEKDHEAASISAGTARIIAMLLAYYALDMRTPEEPGLIVIEEPDTAIHPLLLGNFVDLLRSYTDRKESRQFILTTHNPELLNYLEPEEVRIVERDPATGETRVESVPAYLRETWLDKHRLGDAWTSRIIGGIPEE